MLRKRLQNASKSLLLGFLGGYLLRLTQERTLRAERKAQLRSVIRQLVRGSLTQQQHTEDDHASSEG